MIALALFLVAFVLCLVAWELGRIADAIRSRRES